MDVGIVDARSVDVENRNVGPLSPSGGASPGSMQKMSRDRVPFWSMSERQSRMSAGSLTRSTDRELPASPSPFGLAVPFAVPRRSGVDGRLRMRAANRACSSMAMRGTPINRSASGTFGLTGWGEVVLRHGHFKCAQ